MLIPAEQLTDVLPEALPWIEKAVRMNQGDENTLDVLAALCRNQYSLWYVPGVFAAVVQVVRYPRQSVATILYAGGDGLEAIKHSFEFGKKFAKEHNIDVLRVWGREGWEKLLDLKRVGVILQVTIE
jgi:hypothetical protein